MSSAMRLRSSEEAHVAEVESERSAIAGRAAARRAVSILRLQKSV